MTKRKDYNTEERKINKGENIWQHHRLPRLKDDLKAWITL